MGGANGSGTIYDFDPATGAETVLYSFPGGNDGLAAGALINVGGKFYGTTPYGGDGFGAVYSFDPATGANTVLHTFGKRD